MLAGIGYHVVTQGMHMRQQCVPTQRKWKGKATYEQLY